MRTAAVNQQAAESAAIALRQLRSFNEMRYSQMAHHSPVAAVLERDLDCSLAAAAAPKLEHLTS
jgi:hypothetical protein